MDDKMSLSDELEFYNKSNILNTNDELYSFGIKNKLSELLQKAIEQQNLSVLEKLLNNPLLEPDCSDVFLACKIGNSEIVKLLLRHPTVDPGEFDDEDPLLEAIGVKNPEIVSLLLDSENVLPDITFYDETILENAIDESNYETLEILFKHPKMKEFLEYNISWVKTLSNFDKIAEILKKT